MGAMSGWWMTSFSRSCAIYTVYIRNTRGPWLVLPRGPTSILHPPSSQVIHAQGGAKTPWPKTPCSRNLLQGPALSPSAYLGHRALSIGIWASAPQPWSIQVGSWCHSKATDGETEGEKAEVKWRTHQAMAITWQLPEPAPPCQVQCM